MIDKLVFKVIGTPSERRLKRLRPWLDEINRLEPDIQKLAPEDFPKRTAELKARVAERLAGVPEGTPKEELLKARKAALEEVLP